LELLLNLFWLLLAVPAAWLWYHARFAQPESRIHGWRSLLLVSCVVLLLFPIVSASDDLQLMRPEVEESTARDAQRSAQGCRSHAPAYHAGILALMPESLTGVPVLKWAGRASLPLVKSSMRVSRAPHAGRAPPASS
jgi:hypothetical protein